MTRVGQWVCEGMGGGGRSEPPPSEPLPRQLGDLGSAVNFPSRVLRANFGAFRAQKMRHEAEKVYNS